MNTRAILCVSTGLAFAMVATAFAAATTQYLLPSAKARNEVLVVVPIDDIPTGGYKLYEYLGTPAVIYRPPVDRSAPGGGERNALEVYFRFAPHSACTADYLPPGALPPLGEQKWPGGWIDPCHHGSWDMTGQPLPWNSIGDEAPLIPVRWRYLTPHQIEATGFPLRL